MTERWTRLTALRELKAEAHQAWTILSKISVQTGKSSSAARELSHPKGSAWRAADSDAVAGMAQGRSGIPRGVMKDVMPTGEPWRNQRGKSMWGFPVALL